MLGKFFFVFYLQQFICLEQFYQFGCPLKNIVGEFSSCPVLSIKIMNTIDQQEENWIGKTLFVLSAGYQYSILVWLLFLIIK